MHNRMNIIFKYFMFQIMYDYFVNTTKFFSKVKSVTHFILQFIIHGNMKSFLTLFFSVT